MPDRTQALTLAALAALSVACDATADGRRLHEAGRFEDARAAFDDAARKAGDRASGELLFDEALAALRAGDFSDAEAAAKKAAERGGDVAPLCAFLQGNISFARCGLSETQADQVEAEPFAFDVAIAFGETAKAHWLAAAATRGTWPAALRNAERAALKIEELRRKKAEAGSPNRRKAGKPAPRPVPKPTPGKKPDQPPTQTAAGTGQDGKDDKGEAQVVDLTSEQLAALFDKLAEKEKEKLALRRSRRATGGADVEKDW